MRLIMHNLWVFSEILDLQSVLSLALRRHSVDVHFFPCHMVSELDGSAGQKVYVNARQRKRFGKGAMRFHGSFHAKGSDHTKNGFSLFLCINTL